MQRKESGIGLSHFEDAVATDRTPLLPRGLGVRQPYAALSSVHWHAGLLEYRKLRLVISAASTASTLQCLSLPRLQPFSLQPTP